MSSGQVSNFLDSLRYLISELEGIKVPSIGVVDGYALGGGTEIALGCDLRVGGEPLRPETRTTQVGNTDPQDPAQSCHSQKRNSALYQEQAELSD